METPGSIIDKLITADLKMWNNQEILYEIRRMTYEQFCERFGISVYSKKENSSLELFNVLKKSCDLNVQRNDLINELDEKLIELVEASKEPLTDLRKNFSFKQHKTY